MAGTTSPPGIGDLFAFLGSNNPLTAMSKSVEQFRAAVAGFIDAVSTFKQTMESLNSVTTRMGRVLDELEGPLHLLMPQVTAASEQALRVFTLLSGPVERIAPGLGQLAEMLNNPAMTELPRRLNEAMDVMSNLPKTLSPLSQMAEVAGGLFGGVRGLAGLGSSPSPAISSSPKAGPRTPAPTPPARPAEGAAVTNKRAPSAAPAPARPVPATAAPKKSAAERTAAKRTAAKRTTRKTMPRRAAKRTARKVTAKTTAQKAITKKATRRKSAPSKAGATRPTTRTAASARAAFAKSARRQEAGTRRSR